MLWCHDIPIAASESLAAAAKWWCRALWCHNMDHFSQTLWKSRETICAAAIFNSRCTQLVSSSGWVLQAKGCLMLGGIYFSPFPLKYCLCSSAWDGNNDAESFFPEVARTPGLCKLGEAFFLGGGIKASCTRFLSLHIYILLPWMLVMLWGGGFMWAAATADSRGIMSF